MLDNIPAGIEVVVPVLVFIAVSLQKWKQGFTDTWRDEAEAQKERADRLHDEVAELYREVKMLRAENAELRRMMTKANGTDLGTFLGQNGSEQNDDAV